MKKQIQQKTLSMSPAAVRARERRAAKKPQPQAVVIEQAEQVAELTLQEREAQAVQQLEEQIEAAAAHRSQQADLVTAREGKPHGRPRLEPCPLCGDRHQHFTTFIRRYQRKASAGRPEISDKSMNWFAQHAQFEAHIARHREAEQGRAKA